MKNKLLLLFISILSLGMASAATSVDNFRFDIHQIPFSIYGSYLVVDIDEMSELSGKSEKNEVINSLYIREISGKYSWSDDRIFRIEFLSGDEILEVKSIDCSPGLLRATTKCGEVEITYHDTKSIRLKSKEVSVRLTKIMEDARQWEWTIPISDKQFRVHGGFDKYAITSLNWKTRSN